MSRRQIVLPALALTGSLSVVLAGCSLGIPVTPPASTAVATPTPAPSASSSPDATAPAAQDATGAYAAVLLAESTAGGRATQLDDEDDDANWEVTVAVGDREVEVRVSGDGTSVLSTEDDDDLDNEDREGLAAATVGLEPALRASADSSGGGRLEGAELVREGGGFAWEVDYSGDVEVYVSVTDGSVLRVDG